MTDHPFISEVVEQQEKLTTMKAFCSSTQEPTTTPSKPIMAELSMTKFSEKRFYKCPCGFGGFHLMSEAPIGEEQTYNPSKVEELANTLTHFIPAVLAIFVMMHMIYGSMVANTAREIFSTYVYIGCCTVLFLVSSTYHFCSFLFGFESKITQFCRKCDYSIIFAFIASSYTPWLLCLDIGAENIVGRVAITIVWMIAVFGVVKHLTNMFPDQNVLFLYLVMGWISVFYVAILLYQMYLGYMVTQLNILWCLIWVMGGGVVYSAGTTLWKLDGILPFAHAIWHLAVVVAAGMHIYAVNRYLMILE